MLAQLDFSKIKIPVDSSISNAIDINNPNLKIADIINVILPYIFAITGILLLLYLLFGGFQMMYSAGDPKKMEAAKGKITNAVIGFVIVFIAYWLTQLIGKVFNISIINSIFK